MRGGRDRGQRGEMGSLRGGGDGGGGRRPHRDDEGVRSFLEVVATTAMGVLYWEFWARACIRVASRTTRKSGVVPLPALDNLN